MQIAALLQPRSDFVIQIINICVGSLAAAFATVISFWLGSSQGSRSKDVLAASLQQRSADTQQRLTEHNVEMAREIKSADTVGAGQAGTGQAGTGQGGVKGGDGTGGGGSEAQDAGPGTAHIASRRAATHLDPPLVAAACCAGSLQRENADDNRWRLRSFPRNTGLHIGKFVAWFNDAVKVSGEQGWSAASGCPASRRPSAQPRRKQRQAVRNPFRVTSHKLAKDQMTARWLAWEEAGLFHHVISWEGAFVPRFQRDSTPPPPIQRPFSNHAFGTAFDINAVQNGLGLEPARNGKKGCIRALVPIADDHGFYWGGHFNTRKDGMRFEVAKPMA